jgi:hypothetical protein
MKRDEHKTGVHTPVKNEYLLKLQEFKEQYAMEYGIIP